MIYYGGVNINLEELKILYISKQYNIYIYVILSFFINSKVTFKICIELSFFFVNVSYKFLK